jgi:transcriptional regulator with XRE-family HTH domain
MASIGVQLRLARSRTGLSLRQVEERCARLASQRGIPACKISAGWLDRVESQNRGLSAVKLFALALVYNLTPADMLALCQNELDTPEQIVQIASPNSTLLFSEGPAEQYLRAWLPERLLTDPPSDHTMLLQGDQGPLPPHFCRGVIGRHDRTMEPMILPGSVVLIDARQRAIAKPKAWNSEFDRPIYFLYTRNGCHYGFCELDRKGEWLRLIPHSLSVQREDLRWRYRKEVEVIGTIAALFTRRTGAA